MSCSLFLLSLERFFWRSCIFWSMSKYSSKFIAISFWQTHILLALLVVYYVLEKLLAVIYLTSRRPRRLCYTPNMYSSGNWHKTHKESLSVGDRAADKVRNGMGSWGFVGFFVAFMAVWAFLNAADGFHHWDKYPFILLNLFLSMLAALQGAILLIAAKRADGISAAMAENDYHTNLEAKKEVEELMAVNRKQLELIEELISLLKDKK